jgi:hypothetical protein
MATPGSVSTVQSKDSEVHTSLNVGLQKVLYNLVILNAASGYEHSPTVARQKKVSHCQFRLPPVFEQSDFGT